MRLVYNPTTKTWTDESGNSVKNSIDVGRIVLRQGTTTDLANEVADTGITKYEGEPRWDTDTKQLYVHDGTQNVRVPTEDANGDLTFGNGTSEHDIVHTFNGETNQSTITYMEDEDRFDFGSPIKVPTYARHVQVQAIPSGTVANQATGNTAGTAVGLQFASSPDKYAGFQWEVPSDWDGTDVTVEIDWLPDSGAMSGTDTVEWILEYRAIAEGELVTQGTVATVTVTNSDDNVQYLTIHSPFTIPFNDTNQPLTVGDHVFFLIHRNTGVTNNFAGTVTATAFEINYNSTTLPMSN